MSNVLESCPGYCTRIRQQGVYPGDPDKARIRHLCGPMIFSIQIMLYQRPNLYPH